MMSPSPEKLPTTTSDAGRSGTGVRDRERRAWGSGRATVSTPNEEERPASPAQAHSQAEPPPIESTAQEGTMKTLLELPPDVHEALAELPGVERVIVAGSGDGIWLQCEPQ
jgi:hypothetical protein